MATEINKVKRHFTYFIMNIKYRFLARKKEKLHALSMNKGWMDGKMEGRN